MGKARSLNPVYNVNAILGKKEGINAPNVYFAAKEGYDGYSMVSVSSLPTVELFIGQGTTYQNSITEWTLFNSQETYGGIGANAFARLPNLEKITIWQENNDSPLTIDDNAFYSNVELEHIYVHPDLLTAYQTAYSGKSFVSLFEPYELIQELTVPTQFDGNIAPATLNKAWLDLVFANMPSLERNSKTTLIVPSYFAGIDVGAFNDLGTRFINLEELKCNGAKTFASGFMNGASWCNHLWLDNGTSTLTSPYCTDNTTIYANFRVVAPYLVFANYFTQEHNIKTNVVCPIIGYHQFSANAELPQTSPTGEYLWFSNIDYNTDYNSPTGLENDPSFIDDYEASSSGYYYCYDKTEILVIQDDGNHVLTSALVESAINGLDTPLSWIIKIVVPNTFTGYNSGALDVIDNYNGLNDLELESYIRIAKEIYTNFTSSTTKVTKILVKSTSQVGYMAWYQVYSKRMEFYGTSVGGSTPLSDITPLTNDFEIILRNCETISGFRAMYHANASKAYLPKLTSIAGLYAFRNVVVENGKIFIGTSNLAEPSSDDANFYKTYRYYPASALNYYLAQVVLGSYPNYIIGVIDGNSVYTDKGFTYPTLTGIDTETNIQTLTPSANALYLASDTGDLWQYDSGTWTNLFSGYTPTWYSNEDVSTTISDLTQITINDTIYVKLTAI